MGKDSKTERVKGTIAAVSRPKVFEGKLQCGIMINSRWYNKQGEEAELSLLLEHELKKGNEVEFDATSNVIDKIVSFTAPAAEEGGWQDEIVNFETLLDAAHGKKENFSIETQMLGLDVTKKYALFKATVKVMVEDKGIKHDMVFEAHGDATDENVTGDQIKPHFIRMAETRAICRALRWYTNNAQCSEEEKDKPSKPKPGKEELKVTTEKIGK